MNIDRNSVIAKSFNPLCQLPIGRIRPRGWLSTQLQREIDGLGGHMDELEPQLLGKAHTMDFDSADMAGLIERIRELAKPDIDEATAASWFCEQAGQYWAGLIQLAFVTGDPCLLKKASDWVSRVLRHQGSDGYLGGYRSCDNRLDDYSAWCANWAMRSLLTYFEATGDREVLQACHRGLIWFLDNWSDHYTDYGGPALIESMVIVYLYTKDERLLDWSRRYIGWLDANSRWYNTLSSFLEDSLAYNSIHTVAYGECVKLPALIYAADGNRANLEASVKGIDKILRDGFQRTGAPVSNFEYLSPPGATHATEYCNFATYANTFAWMTQITGQARYGDYLEKIIFNGAQGAKKKDERAIAYLSSPNQVFATDKMSNFSIDWGSYVYAPVFYVACCPTQYVRVMPEFVRAICLTDSAGSLYINAYAPCVIDSGDLTLEQITAYPFEDTVKLVMHLAKPVRKTLALRMPGWCSRIDISINGTDLPGNRIPGSFFPIERSWQDGDRIDIRFEYPVTVTPVACNAMTGAPPYAVERGPLLYALHIPEIWTENPGRPITSLPEGWSWYNVAPDRSKPQVKIDHRSTRYEYYPFNFVLDTRAVVDPACIAVIREDTGNYPWDNSLIKLRVPMHRSRHLYPFYFSHALEIYENPVPADADLRWIDFEPFGCTNLRMSYFPTAQLSNPEQTDLDPSVTKTSGEMGQRS
jgi:hypothetical protein